jgi:hypothetical protein
MPLSPKCSVKLHLNLDNGTPSVKGLNGKYEAIKYIHSFSSYGKQEVECHGDFGMVGLLLITVSPRPMRLNRVKDASGEVENKGVIDCTILSLCELRQNGFVLLFLGPRFLPRLRLRGVNFLNANHLRTCMGCVPGRRMILTAESA